MRAPARRADGERRSRRPPPPRRSTRGTPRPGGPLDLPGMRSATGRRASRRDQCRTSRRRSRRKRNGSGAPRTGHAPWRAPGSSGTRSPRTARRSDGGGVPGVNPVARRPVASAGERRRATSGGGRGGRHRPAVPEVVEAVVRRVPDLERLARAAGGDVLPVVLPDLRDRALVAGELLLVRRAGARAEEATRRAELGVVPDLAETACAGSTAFRRKRAHVVLVEERPAARGDATVVVDHGLRPQERTAVRRRIGVVPELALGVPLAADDPPLVDRDVHLELVGERARLLDVLGVVAEDVELPDEARRGGAEAPLGVAHGPAVLEDGRELSAPAVLLVALLPRTVDRDREHRAARGHEPLGARCVEREAEVRAHRRVRAGGARLLDPREDGLGEQRLAP